MRKEREVWREWLTACPRIVLALLISLVIAKPLEMKIFEKEIQSELVIMEQQALGLQENEVKARFEADQTQLRNEITSLKSELLAKSLVRDELERIAREEADGTGGSKRVNAGPIYKLKRGDADQANLELEQLMQKTNPLIQEKFATISHNEIAITQTVSTLERKRLDGPASRKEALSRLIDQSSAIAWANWFLVLLFIAVETAPVMVKLFSPAGPYDHLLKIEEQTVEGQRVEQLARMNADIRSRTKDLMGTEASFLDDRLNVMLNKS